MRDTKKRNLKIFHLVESTIHDFCKVLECSHYCNNEAIMVQFEGTDLCYIYPEFNKGNFDVNIICMVFQDLSISKAAKLKEIYKSDEIAEFIKEIESNFWFLDDSRLVMGYVSSSEYHEFAHLKSKLLLELYISVQNARRLKDRLEGFVINLEQVSVN
jgi:hypothetical protein